MTANAVGWAILAIGIFFLFRTAQLDHRLQRFRSPGVPASSYLGKFGRWRRDLYTSDGQPLIRSTRLSFALFCFAALLGAVIIENAQR